MQALPRRLGSNTHSRTHNQSESSAAHMSLATLTLTISSSLTVAIPYSSSSSQWIVSRCVIRAHLTQMRRAHHHACSDQQCRQKYPDRERLLKQKGDQRYDDDA